MHNTYTSTWFIFLKNNVLSSCYPVLCHCLSLILSSATVFGQNLRLEPLKPEKKSMWKREMDCLLSVCDYIVEFIPKSQNLQDGTVLEVKFC
jgi:hypothetical protein